VPETGTFARAKSENQRWIFSFPRASFRPSRKQIDLLSRAIKVVVAFSEQLREGRCLVSTTSDGQGEEWNAAVFLLKDMRGEVDSTVELYIVGDSSYKALPRKEAEWTLEERRRWALQPGVVPYYKLFPDWRDGRRPPVPPMCLLLSDEVAVTGAGLFVKYHSGSRFTTETLVLASDSTVGETFEPNRDQRELLMRASAKSGGWARQDAPSPGTLIDKTMTDMHGRPWEAEVFWYNDDASRTSRNALSHLYLVGHVAKKRMELFRTCWSEELKNIWRPVAGSWASFRATKAREMPLATTSRASMVRSVSAEPSKVSHTASQGANVVSLRKWLGTATEENVREVRWSLSGKSGTASLNLENGKVLLPSLDGAQPSVAKLGVVLPFVSASEGASEVQRMEEIVRHHLILASKKTGSFASPPLRHPGRRLRMFVGEVMRLIESEAASGFEVPTTVIAPSQLNGAEFPDFKVIIRAIARYISDETGGPRAQLACHPGLAQLILELAASRGNPDGFHCFKLVERELSEAGFVVDNGYLKIGRADKSHVFMSALPRMGLLVSDDVPVEGLNPGYTWPQTATNRGRISLAYASAAPVNTYNNYPVDSHEELRNQHICSTMLISLQYLAALRFAARRGSPAAKRRVFAMPLGGGVFENEFANIFLALRLAVDALSASEWESIDLQLLVYEGNQEEILAFDGLVRGQF
jgi:hypothetical protein